MEDPMNPSHNGKGTREVVVVTGASAGVGGARSSNNLYDPLPGDYGARGEFDGCSTDYSAQAWVNRYRGWLTLGLGFAALSSLFYTARKSA
ncbi:MAG: hypothetical protein LV473_10755 [Nitrospira sp.]|nr:hypothetical protein [Nitrospira sp.]